MNTSPAAIQELIGYINREVTQLKLEMKIKGPEHPDYDYFIERLNYCEKHKAHLWTMVGKKIPSRIKKKNG